MQPNPHLEPQPVIHGAPPCDARLVVYAVHGRSQTPAFMTELADRIALPEVAYLVPAAKDATWYPGGFMEPLENNQPNLGHALAAVGTHLEWLAAQDIERDRTVLLGFSQGACLLSEFLMGARARYAGAILHTGGFIGPSEVGRSRAAGDLAGMPVLMSSAAEDAWVPMPRIKATAAALAAAGASVELQSYDEQEHHINDDSVAAMRRLLTNLMSLKESQ
jgi:phospholipase/carboxylesterase